MGEPKTALDKLVDDLCANAESLQSENNDDLADRLWTIAGRIEKAIPADAPEQIAALKAELAKVTEELATAQEHIGQPLRLRVTLTKERDAARGDAEALAVAIGEVLREQCGECEPGDGPPNCASCADKVSASLLRKALAAHEENK